MGKGTRSRYRTLRKKYNLRIEASLIIMGGRACIRGMRITVSPVVSLVANGMSVEEILKAYPYLEPEDIKASWQYAAFLANDEVRPFASIQA